MEYVSIAWVSNMIMNKVNNKRVTGSKTQIMMCAILLNLCHRSVQLATTLWWFYWTIMVETISALNWLEEASL